jgi:hypothetical protein
MKDNNQRNTDRSPDDKRTVELKDDLPTSWYQIFNDEMEKERIYLEKKKEVKPKLPKA